MIKRFHIIVLFLALGMFLAPALTYACGTKTTKSCCEKKSSETKSCCKSHASGQDQHGCEGNCDDASCQCSGFCSNLVLPFTPEVKNRSFEAGTEQQKFSPVSAYISSGFLSVWLPPKIG